MTAQRSSRSADSAFGRKVRGACTAAMRAHLAGAGADDDLAAISDFRRLLGAAGLALTAADFDGALCRFLHAVLADELRAAEQVMMPPS